MDALRLTSRGRSNPWHRIMRAAALAVAAGGAAMTLGCGLGETPAGDVHLGTADPGATAITMNDNSFAPAAVSAVQGQPIQLEIHNDGAVNHNFTNDALHVSTGPVKPGEVVTVTVTVPAGATQFVCTWHPGMTMQVNGN